MSSRLHRTTVSSPDASKRSRTVCEIPGNGSAPPLSHPTPPPHSDALISEPAGFYSFSRGVFPLRQLLALFTAARHGNRSCRRRSAPRRKLHCPPLLPSPTHTGLFCLWAHCHGAESTPEGVRRPSVVSASRDLAVGSSCRCGVTRGVKTKNKTEIAGRRPCVALSQQLLTSSF